MTVVKLEFGLGSTSARSQSHRQL